MSLPRLKLISFPLCPYVQRSRITLLEKNIGHEVEYIRPDALPDWFFDVSPLEKVPVLLVDEQPLFESMVICEYLDEITPGSLHPADPFARAINRAWIEFGNEILDKTFTLFKTEDEKAHKHAKSIILDRFDILEENLQHRPYFNGEDFSLLDAAYAPMFRFYEVTRSLLDFDVYEDTPKVKAWAGALLARPSVVQCVHADFMDNLKGFLTRPDSFFGRSLKND